jgi:putative membrane protein
MFILLFLVIAVIAALIYYSKGSRNFLGTLGKDNSSETSPLDILKKRYARGEIDKEEFEQKKKDLGY